PPSTDFTCRSAAGRADDETWISGTPWPVLVDRARQDPTPCGDVPVVMSHPLVQRRRIRCKRLLKILTWAQFKLKSQPHDPRSPRFAIASPPLRRPRRTTSRNSLSFSRPSWHSSRLI